MSLLQCEWNYVGAQTVSRLSALHYNLLRSILTYMPSVLTHGWMGIEILLSR